MALTIEGRKIERVAIVDDEKESRESYGYSIEDMGIAPVFELGPLRNLESSLKEIHAKADAIICDYHLRIRSYSPFDGDQLVALSNIGRFPALLCTTYDDADITLLRSKRRFIPILLRPSTYNPDTIVRGFERCLKESAGKYNPSRKPWRTLVRITQVDESGEYFYIVVPGWNADQKNRSILRICAIAIRQNRN